jgi:hypothetical protein
MRRGRVNRRARARADVGSSDSEDERADLEVTVLRYSQAEISSALERPRDYVRAVQELCACILKFYSSRTASKSLRRILEEDVRQAVLLCDR